MTTRLEHSDRIIATKPGEWLTAAKPIYNVYAGEEGSVMYEPLAMFRVKYSTQDRIHCLDEQARSVSFDRSQMHLLAPGENAEKIKRIQEGYIEASMAYAGLHRARHD